MTKPVISRGVLCVSVFCIVKNFFCCVSMLLFWAFGILGTIDSTLTFERAFEEVFCIFTKQCLSFDSCIIMFSFCFFILFVIVLEISLET